MMKCLEFNFKIVRCACWGFFLEFSSVFRFTNNADEEKRYPSVWLNFPRPIPNFLDHFTSVDGTHEFKRYKMIQHTN